MLSPFYPPFPGGVSEAVCGLASALVARGHEVIVCTSDSYNGVRAPREEVMSGVSVRRLRPCLSNGLVAGRGVVNPFEVVRIVDVVRPDVVHLHALAYLGQDFSCLSLSGRPLVITPHGPVWIRTRRKRLWSELQGRAYMWLLGRRLLSSAEIVVALTGHEIRYLQDWGVHEDRIRVIPWGVGEDCFEAHTGQVFKARLGLGDPLLLFVGRLNPLKGPQHLLHVMPSICQVFPRAHAAFIGPDEGLGRYLILTAHKYRIANHVTVVGLVSRDVLLEAYAACDVFVLPSHYESFGLAIVEAMAAGKPVVSSRIGGIPYVVEDGSSGFLIEPGDERDLFQKIMSLLVNEQLRTRLGKRGRELSRRYQWDVTARAYEQAYMEVSPVFRKN
jgi:glycosyltransferase involved in cell wall biosynthesis